MLSKLITIREPIIHLFQRYWLHQPEQRYNAFEGQNAVYGKSFVTLPPIYVFD